MRFTFFLTAAIGLLSPLVAAVAIEPGLTPADVSPALQIDERSAALAKRASGFLATCRSLSLSGSTLRAECRQENNQWRPSTLILGKCLANSCGALVARNNGQYQNSCRSCSVSSDGYIKCSCGSCGGSWLDVRFNLNNIVGNQNGGLKCFDHWGG